MNSRTTIVKSPRRPHVATGVKGDVPHSAAEAQLYSRYGAKIYALSLRLTRSRADAEDLTQETFMQAVRKWGTFQGRADPGSWLYIITVRLFRKRIKRRKGHERTLPTEMELMPFRDRGVADLPDDNLPAVDRVLNREALLALENAITRLPESFRIPLILKDILELSNDEVGEALAIGPKTIKTRVHRARLMLRKALMRHVDQRPAPAPTYERQVCIDLLRSKLEAMDQGRGFPIGHDVLCERCRSVFAELDLTQNACAQLAAGPIPPRLKSLLARRGADAARLSTKQNPRR